VYIYIIKSCDHVFAVRLVYAVCSVCSVCAVCAILAFELILSDINLVNYIYFTSPTHNLSFAEVKFHLRRINIP
jgi:hypothetical protein